MHKCNKYTAGLSTIPVYMYCVALQLCNCTLCQPDLIFFGPSRVCALPLAAGINVVAIVLGIIFLLSFFLSKDLSQNPRRGGSRVLHLLRKRLGFQ